MNIRLLILIIAGSGQMLAGSGRAIAAAGIAAENRVDYLKQIKPILRERCFSCHGALKQEADLRLDTVAMLIQGSHSGPVLIPGDANASNLIERVTTTDITERMPPEQEGEPLSIAQVHMLRRWIEQGAAAPQEEKAEADPRDHWAFQPIVRPAVPVVGNTEWGKYPVDAFLAQQHHQRGLTPQADASRLILLRRLYFDLIGLPPTAEEIAEFENDQAPEFYARVVERLLEDRRHGERWARHWMDIWRYSDWWGLGQQLRNSQKHIWHWRDWIVESLNADLPYDEMLRLMLAADEIAPLDLSKVRATGYLARNYFLFNRNQWMDETVEHVSKGLLGLTMNCAKCHDHKYDPILQTDYYRMRAFFEPYHVRMNMVPGESNFSRDGIPGIFDGLPDTPTYLFVRGAESNPDRSRTITPAVPEFFNFMKLAIEPIALPVEAWQPQRQSCVIDAYLIKAKQRIESAKETVTSTREKLVKAKKSAKEVEMVQAQLKVAEADLAKAHAESVSVKCRVEAMRAGWETTDHSDRDGASARAQFEREKTVMAVQAERKNNVLKAQHHIAVTELALLRTTDDKKKKSAAEKALKLAQESFEKAKAIASSEVKPDDPYTRLPGAKWTPTRFFDSTKDDPMVEFSAQSTGRRTALAHWITDRRNPLTARVAVNHLWMRHMGAPLVPNLFDFGRKGIRPAHVKLLDWLATELMDNGWSMKHLHRVIVSSKAYRMGSSLAQGEANIAKDIDNRYWWRRTPMRMESQAVRDSILAHAGTLDETLGGPPVLPKEQATSVRRSLYFFHSNNQRNLFLTKFDEAPVIECYRREQSILPQQALALTNSKLVLDAAQKIAPRLAEGIQDDVAYIRKTFAVMLGISANEAEIEASHQSLEGWRQMSHTSKIEARVHFIWALMNHNDFVTIR
jgi:hypothetical protein